MRHQSSLHIFGIEKLAHRHPPCVHAVANTSKQASNSNRHAHTHFHPTGAFVWQHVLGACTCSRCAAGGVPVGVCVVATRPCLFAPHRAHALAVTMVFTKVVKNKAYFKRFQVKYRRRREGKTDYYARIRMIRQDKNKYMSPKYRFVVRLTSSQCICAVVRADTNGDKTMVAAYSSELAKRYGLKGGLKNYAAAYATGLLCARRLLASVGLADAYTGVEEVTGEINESEGYDGKTYYVPEVDEEKRPFRCVLDVGLAATTKGCRIWGALKGASDGGLDIPHSPKQFPGYDKESKSYDASAHRDLIFGANIAANMARLQEENEEAYRAMFSDYIRNGINSENLEEMYEAVHAAIRANPARAEAKPAVAHDKKYQNRAKCNLKQRKNRVAQKKRAQWAKLARAAAAAAGSDGEESD